MARNPDCRSGSVCAAKILAPLALRAVVNRKIGAPSGLPSEPLPHAGSNPHTDPRDPWRASGLVSGVGPSTLDYPTPPPRRRASREQSPQTHPHSTPGRGSPHSTPSIDRLIVFTMEHESG